MNMSTTTKAPLGSVKTLRSRTDQHSEQGGAAVCSAERHVLLRRLNGALATAIVCVLRYRRHYFMARSIHAKNSADEFLLHPSAEQESVDLLAGRIFQSGGEPYCAADGSSRRSHVEDVASGLLLEMIKEDLVAERTAIDNYRALIRSLGDQDSTTNHMLELILAVEEEHAAGLVGLLQGLPVKPRTPTNRSSASEVRVAWPCCLAFRLAAIG